jgi:hypothetical protein
MTPRGALTYDQVHELLDYDPETGVFRWRVSRRGASIGQVAGSITAKGYISIMVEKVNYFAHRLAWFYVHGYFSENQIDHINRIRDDNRIQNLREVSGQCNLRNANTRVDNTSGVCGVYRHEQCRKWAPRITVYGVHYYLGLYEDYEDAVCARLAAEQCLNWEGCDSSSDAYRYVYDPLQI